MNPDGAARWPPAALDAVVSATALHWLDADRWPGLAEDLARLLRPDGVLLDYDQMRTPPATPRLAALTDELHRLGWEGLADGEDWTAWWGRIEAVPQLAELHAERHRRFGHRRVGTGSTVDDRISALQTAGFAEAAPVRQHADRRLLAAIR